MSPDIASNVGDLKCPNCQAAIRLVSITRACQATKVSRKTMYKWIQKGHVTSVRISSGRRLICFSSLFLPNHSVARAGADFLNA